MERNNGLVISIFLIFAFSWCLVPRLSAQVTQGYPKGYFRWPVDAKPEIVANLGELRPNHWHMGLDVRTNQRENLIVHAAASGYIARIRIERSGFGRCIWINHPNGLTTLYAHLNDFFPELEQYVTAKQYENESWPIELEIPKEKFPVTKGQFIAYSGNTGGSQGPHVHFEIRDTKTEECLNPLLFGFPLPDKVKPSILKLALYDRTRSVYDEAGRIFPVKSTLDGFKLAGSSLIKSGTKRISFGIQAIDKRSGTNNEDGIFSARVYFDGIAISGFSLDSISYTETGYLNAHIDYKYRYNGGPYFQYLSPLPGDRGGVYTGVKGDGTIELTDTDIHSVKIEVKDSYGNVSNLEFQVQYDENLYKPLAASSSQLFVPNFVNVLERPGFEMYLPETCLYDTVRSFYFRNNTISEGAVSAIHQVNDGSVPVHGDLSVRIQPDRAIDASIRDRIIIQRTYRNSTDVRKATWEGEWMAAKFSDFGYFQAFADVKAPWVNDPGRGDTINLNASSRIVFTPGDNFGVKSLRAELDGKWLRFTNDKGRNWIYKFDERCPYGKHLLKVTVEDIAGNVTEKEWWFTRYPYKAPPKKVIKKKVTTRKKVTTKKKR